MKALEMQRTLVGSWFTLAGALILGTSAGAQSTFGIGGDGRIHRGADFGLEDTSLQGTLRHVERAHSTLKGTTPQPDWRVTVLSISPRVSAQGAIEIALEDNAGRFELPIHVVAHRDSGQSVATSIRDAINAHPWARAVNVNCILAPVPGVLLVAQAAGEPLRVDLLGALGSVVSVSPAFDMRTFFRASTAWEDLTLARDSLQAMAPQILPEQAPIYEAALGRIEHGIGELEGALASPATHASGLANAQKDSLAAGQSLRDFSGGACPVPTLPEWGLLGMLLSFLAAGSLVLQRRARATHTTA